MGKIIKYNLQNVFKNSTFYFQVIFLTGVVSYTLFALLKDMPFNVPYFIFSRILLLMGSSILAFTTSMILSDLIVYEKITGRIEFLLSNGVGVRSYLFGSIISLWIITEFILIFCVFIANFILFLLLKKSINFFDLIKILGIISIFNIGLASMMCTLVLRIRKVNLINNLLWIIGFSIIFGGNYIMQKIPLNAKYDSFIFLGLALLGIILILVSFVFGKRINNETVVLTIP